MSKPPKDDKEDIIDLLCKQGDRFLEIPGLIDETFHEQLEETTETTIVRDLTNGFENTLSLIAQDDEDLEQLVDLLIWAVASRVRVQNQLLERNCSEELVTFITKMRLRYNAQVHRVLISRDQGDRPWLRLRTEYVQRPDNARPGMDHTITLGDLEEVEITTSISSNFDLIQRLISRQNEAFTRFTNAASFITEEEMEEMETQVKELRRRFEGTWGEEDD